MSCSGCATERLNLVEKFPEKTSQLLAFIDTLPLSQDREWNRSFLIESLHKAQEIYSYLPVEVQLLVADRLDLHLSEVSGVISFYSYFKDQPVGRYKIHVCTGTACFVRGAEKVLNEFKNFLTIDEGETSADGMYSLGGLRCVGACSLAPVVMVNDKVYGNVTARKVADILSECRKSIEEEVQS